MDGLHHGKKHGPWFTSHRGTALHIIIGMCANRVESWEHFPKMNRPYSFHTHYECLLYTYE